jgi:hypothetical protein
MNPPLISKPLTTEELRDRVLSQLNGEAVRLSPADQERRQKVLARLRQHTGGGT